MFDFDTVIAEVVVAESSSGAEMHAIKLVNQFVDRLCIASQRDDTMLAGRQRPVVVDYPMKKEKLGVLLHEVCEVRFPMLIPHSIAAETIHYNYPDFNRIYRAALDSHTAIDPVVAVDDPRMLQRLIYLERFLTLVPSVVNHPRCLLQAPTQQLHRGMMLHHEQLRSVYEAGAFSWYAERIYGETHAALAMGRAATNTKLSFKQRTVRNSIFFTNRMAALEIGEVYNIHDGQSVIPRRRH